MTICVNGVMLFYQVSGVGPPMLLLHGNGEDHHIFDRIVKKLQRNFTVYALDSRNHGQSEKTDDFSYEAMAEDVFAFIRTMKLSQVNIIGFSDGAIIGLMLAIKYRGALRKVALLGVNLSPEDFTEDSFQEIREAYRKTKSPLFKQMLEEPHIELNAVQDVDIPVLIVAAEYDVFKPDTFEALANALPNASLMIMKEHSHDSYIINQDILYPYFIQFFK